MGMVDKDEFNKKVEMLSEDIMLEVITIFLASYPERKSDIVNALKEQNFRDMEFAAHALKNELSQLGAPQILADSQNFLEMIRKGETKELDSTFDSLNNDIENLLIPELKEWYNQHKS